MIFMFRIEEVFDSKRFIASEDSINISYKLPRIRDQEGSISQQPLMAKLRETKAFSERCMKVTIIQRLSSDAKKECFWILKQHSFPTSAVQFLAVEEAHEVVSLINALFSMCFFCRSVSLWKQQTMQSCSKLLSTSIGECGNFLSPNGVVSFAEPVFK